MDNFVLAAALSIHSLDQSLAHKLMAWSKEIFINLLFY
jgi:hypothetical protein